MAFLDADRDGDGLLNLDEFFDYYAVEKDYFVQHCGGWLDKTDDEIQEDYKLLCRLGHTDDGVDFQAIKKANFMVIIGARTLEIYDKAIIPDDDQVPLDWTPEQLDWLK
jgi:hypothetical protein